MPAPLLLLYGSQTGNSREIAKELCEEAIGRGHQARVLGMERFKDLEFSAEEPVIIVASSTGNGDAPDNADKFYRYCKRKSTPPVFSGVPFAVCALGDSNYEQFCEVGRQFDKHLERLGGVRAIKRCDVDEVDGIEAHVDPWKEKLWKALEKAAAAAPAATAENVGQKTSPPPPPAAAPAPPPPQPAAPPLQPATTAMEPAGSGPEAPLLAPIVAARWLTGESSPPPAEAEVKRVLHLELDVSGGGGPMGRLAPGDAIAVLSRNPRDEAESICAHLDLPCDADVAVALGPALSRPAHLQGSVISALEAFEARVDIGSTSSWPPLGLLKLLHKQTPPPGAAEPRLASQLRAAVGGAAHGVSPAASRAAHADLVREKPPLLELLRRLAVKPPAAALLDALPPLAPRWYSLANSILASPGRAHLCLDLATYTTRDAAGTPHLRRGVASHYLARLAQPVLDGVSGDGAPRVAVFAREPSGNELRLPQTPDTPIVLIGPGTGIAPFRAFLQERKHRWSRSQLGLCRVYFGCRSQHLDFLYGDELKTLDAASSIQLRTAFSRDHPDPASMGMWRGLRINIDYVQDLLEDDGALIAEILFTQKGRLYVCGDGQTMAGDVHAALHRITARRLHLSSAEAEAKLTKLMAEGRYCREVWN